MRAATSGRDGARGSSSRPREGRGSGALRARRVLGVELVGGRGAVRHLQERSDKVPGSFECAAEEPRARPSLGQTSWSTPPS